MMRLARARGEQARRAATGRSGRQRRSGQGIERAAKIRATSLGALVGQAASRCAPELLARSRGRDDSDHGL